jgi:hypothetical protein
MLLAAARQIGSVMISMGTAMLFSALTAGEGGRLIAGGTMLVGLSSAGAAMQGGGSRGAGAGTGGGGGGGAITSRAVSTPIRSPSQGATSHVSADMSAVLRELKAMKWTATADISMGKLMVELEAQNRKRNDTT